MQLLFGVMLLAGGIIALLWTRPKSGRPRFFVGTSLETAVAITLVMAIGVGGVLTVGGIVEAFQ
jgi:hypothetical protein